MKPSRNYGVGHTYFTGTAEGGEEIFVIPHAEGGALVITTWGSDYGGGVSKVYEVDECTYQKFKKLPDDTCSWQAFTWLKENAAKFEIKPEN